jgi:hypothetical protein
MYKHVFTVRTLDKAITLGGVEPLHYTFFSHYSISPKSMLAPLKLQTGTISMGCSSHPGPALEVSHPKDLRHCRTGRFDRANVPGALPRHPD